MAEALLSQNDGEQKSRELSPPLVVDLDGTLVRTDLLIESVFVLIKQNPLYVFALPVWLLRGKAFLKRQVGLRVRLQAGDLPYHRELLDYLRGQRAGGRRLVLATGSDERAARQVADHLGLFESVLASDGTLNLSGRSKRDRLVAEFGEGGFDYAGNGRQDLPVWASARKAVLVQAPADLPPLAARVAEIDRVLGERKNTFASLVQALRLHHWLKNLLVFAPLVFGRCVFEPDPLGRTLLAFLAFGLCASGVYLINDLADLAADRRHPRKRQRPLAAGDLPLLWGLASIPLLLGLSLLAGLFLPPVFLGILALYLLLNLAYSFSLKQVALLDVMILAGLYSLRLVAGSASVAIWPSSWLLAFSLFLFLSLALLKRCAELEAMHAAGGETVRGYRAGDLTLLKVLGCASGYLAVLVLAIYISSGAAEAGCTRPEFFWALCPLLFYWLSHLWLTAHRGGMDDDPLVFALRDRASRAVLLLMATALMIAW